MKEMESMMKNLMQGFGGMQEECLGCRGCQGCRECLA